MVNKKGFIRTLEAVIAIIIILSLIYLIIPQSETENRPAILEEKYNLIFHELTYNSDFRDCILKVNNFGELDVISDVCVDDIDNYISSVIPYGFGYEVEICDTAVTCLSYVLPLDITIYTESIFIASEPSRIVRIYFWETA